MSGGILNDVLERGLARDVAIDVPGGARLTYAQLREDVDALALGLLETGVAKGDRVGIWAPNMAEWTLLQYRPGPAQQRRGDRPVSRRRDRRHGRPP